MTKPTDRTLSDADVEAIADRLAYVLERRAIVDELERRGLILGRGRATEPAAEAPLSAEERERIDRKVRARVRAARTKRAR